MSGLTSIGGPLSQTPVGELSEKIVSTEEAIQRENARLASHARFDYFSEQGHEGPAIADLQEKIEETATKLSITESKLIEDDRTRGTLELTEGHFKYFQGLFESRDKFNLDDFQADIKATLESIQDLMNAKMNGRYLFAGTKDNAPPVDITKLPDPHTYALDDTDIVTNPVYYTGDNVTRKDENGKPETLLGSDPVFQNMMKVLNLFIHLDKTMGARYDAEIAEIQRLSPGVMEGINSLEKQQAYIEGRHRSDRTTFKQHQQMEGVALAEMSKKDSSEVFIVIQEYNRRLQGYLGLTRNALDNAKSVVDLATNSNF